MVCFMVSTNGVRKSWLSVYTYQVYFRSGAFDDIEPGPFKARNPENLPVGAACHHGDLAPAADIQPGFLQYVAHQS